MGFAGVRHRVKRTRWGADTEELDASGSKVESDTGTDANLVLGSGPSQDFSTRDNANGLKPLKKRRTRWGDDEGQESSETDLKGENKQNISSKGKEANGTEGGWGEASFPENETSSIPKVRLTFGKSPMTEPQQKPTTNDSILPSFLLGQNGLPKGSKSKSPIQTSRKIEMSSEPKAVKFCPQENTNPGTGRVNGLHTNSGMRQEEHKYNVDLQTGESHQKLEGYSEMNSLKSAMTIPEQTKLHTLETSTLQNPSAHSFDSTDPKHQPCSLVLSSIKANASEDDLRHLFGGVGKVVGCKIVRDEKSKNHTGLGFVMMSNQADAHEAKKKFDGFLWGGERLQVSLKSPVSTPVPQALPLNSSSQIEEILPPPPPRPQPLAYNPPISSIPSIPPPQAPWASSSGGGAVPVSAPQPIPFSMQQGSYATPYAYPPQTNYEYHTHYTNNPGNASYVVPNELYHSNSANGLSGHIAPNPPNDGDDERPPGVDDEGSGLVMNNLEEDERPPGVEDEDLLPKSHLNAPEADKVAEKLDAPKNNTESQEISPSEQKQDSSTKQPVVIHVPLKIPEGAKKKQEEKRKAKEKRAKEKEADHENKVASNQHKLSVKPEQVKIVKGTFKEVLARREAEKAALKRLRENSGARQTRSRSPFRRQSRSPPRPKRSPSRRRMSPSRRERSPLRNRRSPLRRSPSRRSNSPRRRTRSLRRQSRSPVQRSRSRSRGGYSRSPSRSPLKRSRSPRRSYSRSPLKRDRSASRYSRSPVRNLRSNRRNKSRVDIGPSKRRQYSPDPVPRKSTQRVGRRGQFRGERRERQMQRARSYSSTPSRYVARSPSQVSSSNATQGLPERPISPILSPVEPSSEEYRDDEEDIRNDVSQELHQEGTSQMLSDNFHRDKTPLRLSSSPVEESPLIHEDERDLSPSLWPKSTIYRLPRKKEKKKKPRTHSRWAVEEDIQEEFVPRSESKIHQENPQQNNRFSPSEEGSLGKKVPEEKIHINDDWDEYFGRPKINVESDELKSFERDAHTSQLSEEGEVEDGEIEGEVKESSIASSEEKYTERRKSRRRSWHPDKGKSRAKKESFIEKPVTPKFLDRRR